MLKKLRLKRFKNFEDADLTLGSLTLLIGANVTGNSNLRDAFRYCTTSKKAQKPALCNYETFRKKCTGLLSKKTFEE